MKEGKRYGVGVGVLYQMNIGEALTIENIKRSQFPSETRSVWSSHESGVRGGGVFC